MRKTSKKKETSAELQIRLKKEIQKKQIEKRLAELIAASDRQMLESSITYYVVRRKNGKLKGSKPHPNQNRFHRDGRRVRMVEGGNRSGKSAVGINEDVAHALGFRPWLEEDDPAYRVNVCVPNKGLIIGESFGEQVKKVLVPKLLGDYENGIPGAIPRCEIAKTKANATGVITFIKFRNGSTIDLQSYDQDVDLFESTDYDWIHYDEPPPRPIWVATQRGLTDRCGRCWMTMTPLKEPWIFDDITSKAGLSDSDISLFRFDIYDNCGYGLTEKGIKAFESTLTEDEKEARLRGRWYHLVGTVYKSYMDRPHRIPRMDISPEWTMWMHVDTHPRTPHHAVWIVIRPDNTKIVIGELKNSDTTNKVGPFVEAIKVYEKKFLSLSKEQIKHTRRLIEPGAHTPNPVADGLSIADEFTRCGLFMKKGSKNRDAAILLMQKALENNPEKGLSPTIYFFNDLVGIHREMTHYIWDDYKGKTAQGRTQKQTPKDADDHYIEGMHRILLDDPRYVDYSRRERARHSRPKPVCAETGW